MEILANGWAVCGKTHHRLWVKTEGLQHDKFFVAFLAKLVKERAIKNVIQGGAHIGTLTKGLLESGCYVVAFEPNPEAMECLKHNCGEANLDLHPFALGEVTGPATLHVDQDNAGASWCEVVAGNINTVSLDDVFDAGDIDCIFADLEGFEPKMLRGARKLMARCRPVMVLEVNEGALRRVGESRQGLFELLLELDYSWQPIQPGLSMDAPMFDVLALPK